MDNFIAWVTDHWGNVVILAGILTSGFAIVARFTPTPKDDAWAAWLMDKLNVLPESAKKQYEEEKAP